MTEPDLHAAGKLFAETALGANAMYYLHEGRQRPTRDGGNEGGLLPDPQPSSGVERASFWVGGLTLRWVLLHVLIFPFLIVWLAIMALPPLALAAPGSSITWYDIVWLAITGLIGLRFLIGIFRGIDGRPTPRRAPANPPEEVWVEVGRVGLVVPASAVRPPLPRSRP